MKDRYTIFVCHKCDEQNQFAGFCDTCHVRLELVVVVPAAKMHEQVEQIGSPAAQIIVEEFVDCLLGRSSRPSG